MMRTDEHKKSRHHRSNAGSFINGLVWGAAIGGILGILFAPDKGAETRKKVKKIAKEYEGKGKEAVSKAKIEYEKTRKKYEELKKDAEPYVEEAKARYEEIKENVEPTFEEARDRIRVIRKEVERGKDAVIEALENISDDMEDETKKIKKKYFRGVKKR